MTEEERRKVWGGFMEVASHYRESLPVLKTDIRAAVNSLDDWLESKRAEINLAIPQPVRGSLSILQKERLFLYVVARKVVLD